MKKSPTTYEYDLSIVVPLLDEEESLPELEEWIRKTMETHQFRYEIIFVDDGSNDDSWDIIQQLTRSNPHVRGFDRVSCWMISHESSLLPSSTKMISYRN